MRAALLLLTLGFAYIPNARCQGVKHNPQSQQQPTQAKAVKDAPSPNADKGNAASKQEVHRDYPILVKEMPPKDGWDKTYIVLTGCLVIIGAVTVIGILIQANETRKAAQAARDSIKLQELGYTQWVNLRNWRVNKFGPVTSDGVHINVNFDIVNPTNLPLTVTKVTVLSAIGTGRSLTIGTPYFLAPGKDYSSGFNIHLPDARVDSVGEIIFTPVGQENRILVEYEDILKKGFSQEFEVSSAAKSRLDVSFISSNVPVPKPLPKREQQHDRPNPN